LSVFDPKNKASGASIKGLFLFAEVLGVASGLIFSGPVVLKENILSSFFFIGISSKSFLTI